MTAEELKKLHEEYRRSIEVVRDETQSDETRAKAQDAVVEMRRQLDENLLVIAERAERQRIAEIRAIGDQFARFDGAAKANTAIESGETVQGFRNLMANAITAALPSSSVADCRALMIAKFNCENQTSRNGRSFRSLMPCATSPSLPITVPVRRFFGYCASSGTPLLINWSKRSAEGTAPCWSRSLKNASKAASATGSEAGAAALADAAAGAWAKSAGQTETSDERIRTRNNEWVIIGDGKNKPTG